MQFADEPQAIFYIKLFELILILLFTHLSITQCGFNIFNQKHGNKVLT